jgi:hypothetical protein
MGRDAQLNRPARIWILGTFCRARCNGQRQRTEITSYFTDGGGASVISQLIIVNEIMHRIQWNLKLDSVPRPCEYAELMVGSGLGAYVTGSIGIIY